MIPQAGFAFLDNVIPNIHILLLIQGKDTVLHLHSSHLKSFTGAQIVIIENIKKICFQCETVRADTWIVCFINEGMLRQPSALLST